MIDHQIGMELHQKHFRGGQLTKEEELQLKAWYDQEDEKETAILKVSISEKNVIEQLREQINSVLNQLTQLTQNIQLVAKENDEIRKKNARLFQLLDKKSDSKAA